MSQRSEARATSPPASDADAEREIDLRRVWERWRATTDESSPSASTSASSSARSTRMSGGSLYVATTTIAPGQAFNPGRQQRRAHVSDKSDRREPDRHVRGHDPGGHGEDRSDAQSAPWSGLDGGRSTDRASPPGGRRSSTSTSGSQEEARPRRRERYRDRSCDGDDVPLRQALAHDLQHEIENFNERLVTLQRRIDLLDKALKEPGLSLNESLLLAIQLDQAQGFQGQTTDSLTTAQQQLLLAQDVELTQIIQQAKAAKTTGRSRRTSIIVGALIGLIGGLLAAIVVDRRAGRARTA